MAGFNLGVSFLSVVIMFVITDKSFPMVSQHFTFNDGIGELLLLLNNDIFSGEGGV
jgi:hypothetical protein